MRRTVFAVMGATALLAGFVPVVSAADMPVKAAPKMAAPMTWTGFYVGLEMGGGWGNASQVVTSPTGTNFTTGDTIDKRSISGALAGVTAGADYQIASWVVGVKGSIDAADITNQTAERATQTANTVTGRSTINWVAMGVGRVGYLPMNNILLYADGGGAWAGSQRSGAVTSPAGVLLALTSGNETLSGWTAGVGVEYRPWQNVSVLLEYNYVDFGTRGIITNVLTGVNAGTSTGRNLTETLNVIKLGANYRF